MKELTGEEIDYIIEYTGMDVAVNYSLKETPVVHFTRNKNTIAFVTMFSIELNKSAGARS